MKWRSVRHLEPFVFSCGESAECATNHPLAGRRLSVTGNDWGAERKGERRQHRRRDRAVGGPDLWLTFVSLTRNPTLCKQIVRKQLGVILKE